MEEVYLTSFYRIIYFLGLDIVLFQETFWILISYFESNQFLNAGFIYYFIRHYYHYIKNYSRFNNLRHLSFPKWAINVGRFQ